MPERRPRQGHPVLPAVEATHGEGPEGVGAQAVAVAGRPGQPFLVRRHELAVHRAHRALRIEVDERGVDAVPPAIQRPLDHAQIDGGPVIAGALTHPVEMPRLQLHGLIEIVGVDLLLERRVEGRPARALDPEGITGHQGLAEGHQPGACGRGLLDASLQRFPIGIAQRIVIAVVFQNYEWGAEKKNQIDYYDNRFIGTQLPENPDYANIVMLILKGHRNFQKTDAYKIVQSTARIPTQFLEEGMQNGEFRPDMQPHLVRAILWGTVEHLVTRKCLLGKPKDLLGLADDIIDTIFRGIMVPQKEPFIKLKVNIEDNLKPKGGRS